MLRENVCHHGHGGLGLVFVVAGDKDDLLAIGGALLWVEGESNRRQLK